MALFRILVALAILAIVVPKTLAIDHIVGDKKGWTLNFDYQAWAKGKEFHVGDRLVFKYPQGYHNVLKVNGTGFQQCMAAANTEPLETGNDIIELKTPGRKWYICGIGKHCAVGKMKLVITVSSLVGSPAPAPVPSPVRYKWYRFGQ